MEVAALEERISDRPAIFNKLRVENGEWRIVRTEGPLLLSKSGVKPAILKLVG